MKNVVENRKNNQKKFNSIRIIKIIVIVLLLLDIMYIFLNNKSININNIIKDINKKDNAIENKQYSYNNPFVPDGFTRVNTSSASWKNIDKSYNKGLVIEDNFKNQFVWVPVDLKLTKFQKDFLLPSIYNANADNTKDLETEKINEQNESIKKYGGFYISRYESCFDYNDSNIRVAAKESKKATDTTDWSNSRTQEYDGYLWNYITFKEAQKYSENMAKSYGYNQEQVETCLVSGTQWDTTINWINENNNLTSNQYGNYINSDANAKIDDYGKIHVSGYSNNWCINNIYDMAGNLWEWTDEKYSEAEDEYVSRGGSYIYDGSVYTIGYRTYNNGSKTYARIGFRTSLILK